MAGRRRRWEQRLVCQRYAVAVDGVDGWVDGDDMDALFDGEARLDGFTISFWVSVNDAPGSGSGLVSVGPPAGGGLQMYWSTETGAHDRSRRNTVKQLPRATNALCRISTT